MIRIDQKHILEMVTKAEQKLTPGQSRVFIDYFIHGYTIEQIAREAGVTKSAISSMLGKASTTILSVAFGRSEDR